ncbi:MAG TPA: nucleotidyltransferase family protein [Chitinophagaceae bacterium]|nr:nucleotidyltransferase family protein [Chitinophagaceae bacterium]
MSSPVNDKNISPNFCAIILAGGLGTRLRSAVPDLPKCMAPVKGRPFIGYVIEYLAVQGVTKFILSLGYMHEVLIAYVNKAFPALNVDFVIEEEPLGTGGAIKYACCRATDTNVLVTNGDTMFNINVAEVMSFHLAGKADCTLSLKPMHNFDRYGVVTLNSDSSIQSFKEKQHYTQGLINGGMYVLNAPRFLEEDLPAKFSFEKDYLEKLYTERRMFGIIQDAYFIDIGIPEDYMRAQAELR